MTTREENIKKINENIELLSDEQLEQVAGGTFDKNKFDERIYNQAGLKTEYHFWEKDEFWAKDRNGEYKAITYDQANWAVEYWQTHNKTASYESIIRNCKN